MATQNVQSAESENLTQPLFTCLSCSIAFHSAEEQRLHYRSDHHRYNMKRRVASLPPVSALVFNQKVMERRAETAVMISAKGSSCDVCNKTYTTENAYRSHMKSKKHKENEIKASSKTPNAVHEDPPQDNAVGYPATEPTLLQAQPMHKDSSQSTATPPITVRSEVSETKLTETIDEKIAAARSRLSQTNCLFCPAILPSLEENLTHMSTSHSFFIPDRDYLIDLLGLITYLGEKIAVGNVCIYCNEKGREFRTLEAVRKHMVDKSHCKVAYDSENDRLEVSDFYDFSSSYPDQDKKKKTKTEQDPKTSGDGDWEDVDGEDNESVDEVLEVSESEADDSTDSGSLPDNQITYGDSHLELVLPSGVRIGHRSMRRYYAQSFPGTRNGKPEDPNSGAALVRRLLTDKRSALVPRKGGFGAFGSGTEVVKARNHGEAREAGRHVREFRDQKRREDFKTRVGFINNAQKHYRDPLLQ